MNEKLQWHIHIVDEERLKERVKKITRENGLKIGFFVAQAIKNEIRKYDENNEKK